MQLKVIHLSDFVLDYKKEKSLPAKLQRLHNQKQKVHLIDVDGTSIIAKNNLSRKNNPWMNPTGNPNQWTTIENLWKSRYRPQTRRECVFYALDLLGDQTSLKTLCDCAEELYQNAIDEETHPLRVRQLQFWEKVSSKYGVDLFDIENYDEYYKKYRCKINLSLSAFAKLWNDWMYLWNCYSMQKHHCVIYRQEWRRHHGSTHDCRTYNGQPDRDMIADYQEMMKAA